MQLFQGTDKYIKEQVNSNEVLSDNDKVAQGCGQYDTQKAEVSGSLCML